MFDSAMPEASAIRTRGGDLRLARLKARRKLWVKAHLYLGLVLGLFLCIFGVTGSVLVFWQEIDEILNPDLMTVAPPKEGRAAYRPLSEIEKTARAALPPGGKLRMAHYPHADNAAVRVSYRLAATGNGGFDSRHMFINPYTAELIGQRVFYRAGNPVTFIAFMFKAHYTLLLKDTGLIVVAAFSALLIISILTGLILWWPLGGKWRRVFVVQWPASGARLNYDLHQTAGFYSAPVVFVVLFTGLYMNLPDRFTALVELFSHVNRLAEIKSSPQSGRTPISLAEANAIAERLYPEGEPEKLSFPADKTGAYRICKKEILMLSRFIGSRCVLIDQYDGSVLHVQDPASGTGGDIFLMWQRPLHYGTAFGWTGRILVFLSGLVCPALFATGIIRWRQKRRASLHRRTHPKQKTAMEPMGS